MGFAVNAQEVSTPSVVLRSAEIGEPPVPGKAAPLRDLLRRALETHPRIRAARARLDGSRFGLSAAKWARYPSLSATMSRNDNHENVRQLQLQQPLWAGGRITSDISANEARVRAAIESVREAEFQLSDEVLGAAVDLSRYRTLLARARESLASYEALFDAITRRSEGGVGLYSDVILAQSRIEQMRAVVAQYEATARRSFTRWMALTGVDPGELIVPDEPLKKDWSVQALVAEAKAFSPVIARLRAEAQASTHEADVTRAERWPQLSLRAIHTKQSDVELEDDTVVLGVLEYQPGAGLATIDRARAAYSQRDAALAQIDLVEREVEEKVLAAHADLKGFVGRAAALAAAAAATGEVIDSFIRQYNIGKRSWLDVLNAQREWSDTRLLAEETRFNALAAEYRLALYSGRYFN